MALGQREKYCTKKCTPCGFFGAGAQDWLGTCRGVDLVDCMSKDKKIFTGSFDSIIAMENLLLAWREFARGKTKKCDVQEFERHLIENLVALQGDLSQGTYRHGVYQAFKINDPKPRDIHKALVRDRVLHHVLYRSLAPFFFRIFIVDSYSCQLGKGTHKALDRFTKFAQIVSKNNTKQCFVLKCDIRKFFASIDHKTLFEILESRISDERLLRLLHTVVDSFNSGQTGKGLPLGNLTSQLLVNVYMHEFDMYMKQVLKEKYYIRYADDFVVLASDREYLDNILCYVGQFLEEKLALSLHPKKVSIETFGSGVDFLGWVHFPQQRLLRTVTKRRMFRKISGKDTNSAARVSYLGMLRFGSTYRIQENIYTKWQT